MFIEDKSGQTMFCERCAREANKDFLNTGLAHTCTSPKKKKPRQKTIWQHIKQKCDNPKNKNFHNYGGRGISYPKKWKTFEGFWGDMKENYSDDLSIDRIDNDKGYSKDNCRWATQKEQCQNMRKNVKYNGVAASERSRQLGGERSLIYSRLKLGFSKKLAFTLPKQVTKNKIIWKK